MSESSFSKTLKYWSVSALDTIKWCCWQIARKDRAGSALKLKRWGWRRWSWENGERKRKRNPLFSLSWISSFHFPVDITCFSFKSSCHSSLSPPAPFVFFASFSCFFSCFFSSFTAYFDFCQLFLVLLPFFLLSLSQLLSFRLFLFVTFFIQAMFLIVSMQAFLFFSLSVTPTQALLWHPGFRLIKVLSLLNIYNKPMCPGPVFHCRLFTSSWQSLNGLSASELALLLVVQQLFPFHPPQAMWSASHSSLYNDNILLFFCFQFILTQAAAHCELSGQHLFDALHGFFSSLF